MVSEGQRHVALKHNEQVGVNKRLLARVIHVVFFFLVNKNLLFEGIGKIMNL